MELALYHLVNGLCPSPAQGHRCPNPSPEFSHESRDFENPVSAPQLASVLISWYLMLVVKYFKELDLVCWFKPSWMLVQNINDASVCRWEKILDIQDPQFFPGHRVHSIQSVGHSTRTWFQWVCHPFPEVFIFIFISVWIVHSVSLLLLPCTENCYIIPKKLIWIAKHSRRIKSYRMRFFPITLPFLSRAIR